MLRKTLLGFALLIAAFAAYVAMQPDELRVERQATFAVPPDALFAQVNDLRRWDDWSPWSKLDPHAKVSFEGPQSGKGATFLWSGNEQIGEGRMTIVDSRPSELVDLRVDFTKPFENTSHSTFTFKPEGDQTRVTWSMSGRQNFLEKAICIVFNGKKMLGAELEKGLANLRQIAGRNAVAPPSSTPAPAP